VTAQIKARCEPTVFAQGEQLEAIRQEDRYNGIVRRGDRLTAATIATYISSPVNG